MFTNSGLKISKFLLSDASVKLHKALLSADAISCHGFVILQ